MADLRAKARDAGWKVSGTQKFSGERFRDIFHQSPVMVYMTDLEGTFLEINRAGVELLGYGSREEWRSWT
ncbi:MAG TPA: PAS domain S-box protein [Syntrophales bacterium]|mgnify:CR=1 FL=1|nr:PAS domain S-box protein [Syntrophales bacterium]